MSEDRQYAIADALQAQRAMRAAAGLREETFPIPAFVGMVSDEIEALRAKGKTDAEIADLITSSSPIHITADEIARFYATPDERGHHG